MLKNNYTFTITVTNEDTGETVVTKEAQTIESLGENVGKIESFLTMQEKNAVVFSDDDEAISD